MQSRRGMKFVPLIFCACLMLSIPSRAFAGEATTGDYLMDIGTKFVRGLGNMVQSPGEMACGVMDDTQERRFLGVFTGLGKGALFMLRRLLVGATEVGTFMIPMEPTLPPLCQVD